jgi:uncharacterized membrane protein
MDTSILRISPQGYSVFFMLFSSVTVILAFIIYALLCSGKFRRPQFREGRKLSRVSALLIVTPLAGVLLWHIYSYSWGYFFTLESNAKSIDIGYYYPARKIALNKADIVAIHVTSHIRKGGTQYRLVIRIKNGDEYISQFISQNDIGRILATIEKELNIKVKIS